MLWLRTVRQGYFASNDETFDFKRYFEILPLVLGLPRLASVWGQF
jgi:hypothetical protein